MLSLLINLPVDDHFGGNVPFGILVKSGEGESFHLKPLDKAVTCGNIGQ